ncbi:MAG: response regulator transcription factor [Bacteroidota bacterium]
MNEPKAHILLVEDDRNLGFVVEDNLSLKGYHITRCEDGDAGWKAFQQGGFDLCILDVMLPKQDGFSLAEQIRKVDTQVPILFLTAKSMKEDRLKGFALGGDDYILKPFSIEELIARMEVFLRRSRITPAQPEPSAPCLGEYTFDSATLTLAHPQETRRLTAREAEVLTCLLEHCPQLVKREEILLSVWGDDDYFLGRSLDVFISRLRKYLRHDPVLKITNIHGVGFQLEVT